MAQYAKPCKVGAEKSAFFFMSPMRVYLSCLIGSFSSRAILRACPGIKKSQIRVYTAQMSKITAFFAEKREFAPFRPRFPTRSL
jgi:hypothetical protein